MNKTNQTTLFRFVNMRSPELTKKENQDKRFVFYPEGTTGGVFHIAVKNKAANATKWEAMLKAAKDFTPFATAQQIEEAYSPYFELADWVSRNKSTLNPEELAAAITKLHEQNLDAENKFLEALSGLWDNLFYQVLMQKDFYVKETVMQLLVLQNILRNQTQLYYKELAAQLLNAKVVLPKELFDELALKLSETITDAEDNDNVVPQALVEAQQIEEAKIASANIARVLSEIEGLEGEHCENEETRYNVESAKFQKDNQTEIKNRMAGYKSEYKKQMRAIGEKFNGVPYDHNELCNQPTEEYPDLPKFEFSETAFNIAAVKNKLPATSQAALTGQVGDLNSFKSVASLKQTLAYSLQNTQLQVANKTQTSTRVVVLGDTAIQLDRFVPAADLFKFQICSSSLADGNISVYMAVQLPAGYDVRQFAYTLHCSDKKILPPPRLIPVLTTVY